MYVGISRTSCRQNASEIESVWATLAQDTGLAWQGNANGLPQSKHTDKIFITNLTAIWDIITEKRVIWKEGLLGFYISMYFLHLSFLLPLPPYRCNYTSSLQCITTNGHIVTSSERHVHKSCACTIFSRYWLWYTTVHCDGGDQRQLWSWPFNTLDAVVNSNHSI